MCSCKKTPTVTIENSVSVDIVVARDGIEPPTQGFSVIMSPLLSVSLSRFITEFTTILP